jgi:hypothetical protein
MRLQFSIQQLALSRERGIYSKKRTQYFAKLPGRGTRVRKWLSFGRTSKIQWVTSDLQRE